MVATTWYLQPWGNERLFTGVSIDPTTVSGQKGIFGQALFLPYSILELLHDSPLGFHLLSLEGWIGWSTENKYSAKLYIPSQTVWDNPNQPGLQVPITNAQIEAIEEARKGNNVNLTISLGGLAVIKSYSTQVDVPSTPYADRIGDLIPIQASNPNSLTIEREHWLRVLEQLGAGAKRLIELPQLRLPREMPEWVECMRLLEGATQLYRVGEYEQALVNCRKIVEGIPHVLCAVWGLPSQRAGQAFENWVKELANRLNDAWQNDHLTPGMLRTMLAGAWQWSAPAPHYGTGIPLREEVAFALGLCTDLLSFAGQVLRAHPDLLVMREA